MMKISRHVDIDANRCVLTHREVSTSESGDVSLAKPDLVSDQRYVTVSDEPERQRPEHYRTTSRWCWNYEVSHPVCKVTQDGHTHESQRKPRRDPLPLNVEYAPALISDSGHNLSTAYWNSFSFFFFDFHGRPGAWTYCTWSRMTLMAE